MAATKGDTETTRAQVDTAIARLPGHVTAVAAGADGAQAVAQYLKALSDAANNAVLDPIMTGAADYANALDRAMTAIYAGQDIQTALNDVAKEWDAITNKLGVESRGRRTRRS